MDRLKSVPITVVSDLDNTNYGKFLKNEEKIRNLATADPNSYAAVVVRSIDHFTAAQAMMKEYLSKPHRACCVQRILNEFSSSIRESELFALWTPDLRRNLKNMANDALESQGSRTSDLDRDARVCSAMLMTQGDPAIAIKFLDVCRKKYPNEVFFHRIYCDLFSFTKDLDSGLKASEEVSKLFPNNANIFLARASLLRMTIDTGNPDYRNWARQKKQIEVVKQAYKNYLKVASKDHRQFAENNYVLAYLSFKYSNPSSQMSPSDLQELSLHFQNGLNAEVDVLPCFLPFSSETKEFVLKYVKMHPTTHIYQDGDTCTIDMTTHGIPGRSKPRTVPTENMTFVDMRKPTERRVDVCVPHRQLLKNWLSDPATAILTQLDDDPNTYSTVPTVNNDSDDFEEIILYQMTLSRVSEVFISKIIQLTVAEDSLYSITSGFFEMVVADTTGDVIKLQLYLGTESPESHTLKELMKKFRFGTVWSLRNPDFHMENGDEKTMYIRAGPEHLIRTYDGQDGRKCRNCFKLLVPGQHCSKCKRAAYCGKECQIQDWKYIKHNLICSEAYNNFYN